MSALDLLAERIRRLPVMVEEQGRISATRRVGETVQVFASDIGSLAKQARLIDLLTRGSMASAVQETIAFSNSQARALKKLLQPAKFGDEKKISECLDNIAKKKQALETQRTIVWTKVQSEIRAVETVYGIAMALSLDSTNSLQMVLSKFRSATNNPPTSEAGVDLVLAAREQSKAAIANSGLRGNVQKILEGAIAERGDPRLLLEKDVQEFLTDHPSLWQLLKLKLA